MISQGRVLLLLSMFVALGSQVAWGQDRAAVSQHVLRGNQLMARHQYKAALEEYETAGKLDPSELVIKRNIIECHNNWGTFLFRQRKYEDAIAEFESCLALDPRHNFAKHNLSLVHQAMEHEGIPLPEPGTKGGREQKAADKETGKEKAAAKPSEPAAKITASSAPADPATAGGANTLFGSFSSTSGSGLYMTGSPLYPTYKKTPSAGSVEVNRTQPPMVRPAGTTATPPDIKAAAGSQVPGFTASQNTRTPEADDSAIAPDPAPSKPSAPVQPAASVPVQPAASTPAARQPEPPADDDPAPGSIEEKIGELEKNITGKTCSHMSYLKRLEQLEIKLFKQPRTGTLDERVEFLRKKVGL